jgi:hypothetical protein
MRTVSEGGGGGNEVCEKCGQSRADSRNRPQTSSARLAIPFPLPRLPLAPTLETQA